MAAMELSQESPRKRADIALLLPMYRAKAVFLSKFRLGQMKASGSSNSGPGILFLRRKRRSHEEGTLILARWGTLGIRGRNGTPAISGVVVAASVKRMKSGWRSRPQAMRGLSSDRAAIRHVSVVDSRVESLAE